MPFLLYITFYKINMKKIGKRMFVVLNQSSISKSNKYLVNLQRDKPKTLINDTGKMKF